ncbi:MAG: ABC transporter ATP-binding protein [Chitinophagaceae bacterium]|nr:MAG: ABC transporter ATP-binding protein [Chitinophagaceae bacterium]
MPEKLIDVQHLTISFPQDEGRVQVVNDISFHIDKGEVIGLVGESGSGKSVTSLSLMRLLPVPPASVDSGKILFYENGSATNLLGLKDEGIRHYRGNKLGMIFQEPMSSLNPVFTCGDQLVEAIRLHQDVSRQEAERKVTELFRQVKLPDPEQMLGRYPHQLSGGQKQRVMIAMAICCNPQLVIADEPTTALDVTVQKAIIKLLKDLQQQLHISILFITHDLGVVAEIADRVIVMYRGRIVEQGSVEQIFHSPQHPYTKGLLACRPPLDRQLKKLPVIADFMEEKDGKIVEKNTDIEKLLKELEIPPSQNEFNLEALMKKQPVLQVKDLVTRFPGKKNFWGKTFSWTYAVNKVNFELFPGETLGLVGESGCGKTTLGRTILQLIRPASGEVIYRGQELSTMPEEDLRKLRKKVQIIFQDPYSSLNPRLSVGEAIMEPMQVHGMYGSEKRRKQKTLELLEKVTLKPEFFNRYPHEFSGGQRQRIGIARALAVEPDFIICDESVSALDVSVQAQVLNLLLQLKDEFQFSCIFISHDLSVVKFMCDRIIVMNKGQIEEVGTSDEVYYHPKTAYTRQLIAAIPKIRV